MNHKCLTLNLVTSIVLLLSFGAYGFDFQLTYDEFVLDPSCIDPKAACSDAEVLDKVYDPEDCHQYYQCIKVANGDIVPSNGPVRCTDGQYFDYYNQSCTEEVESCTKACVNDNCPTTCPTEDNSIIADEYDCGKFYICLNGVKSAATSCNTSVPYFNGIECTTHEYSCCSFCTSVCTEGGIEVRDPYDCRRYYLCEEEGAVNEDLHFNCPEGTYFDSTAGYCITETEPCIPLCSSSTSLYSKVH